MRLVLFCDNLLFAFTILIFLLALYSCSLSKSDHCSFADYLSASSLCLAMDSMYESMDVTVTSHFQCWCYFHFNQSMCKQRYYSKANDPCFSLLQVEEKILLKLISWMPYCIKSDYRKINVNVHILSKCILKLFSFPSGFYKQETNGVLFLHT